MNFKSIFKKKNKNNIDSTDESVIEQPIADSDNQSEEEHALPTDEESPLVQDEYVPKPEEPDDIFGDNDADTEVINTRPPDKVLKDNKGLNKKMLVIIISIILGVSVIGVGGFMAIKLLPKAPVAEVVEVNINQKTLDSVSMMIPVGTTKADIVLKYNIPEAKVKQNSVTLESFNRILDYDFLTTFIFKDDTLVATVHERIMDGSQKNTLAVEFQEFVGLLSEGYVNDYNGAVTSIDKKWLGAEMKYDNNSWNKAIVENNLELSADIEHGDELIRVMASGINYFNFLASERKNSSIGNMIVVYTNIAYADDFSKFTALAMQ